MSQTESFLKRLAGPSSGKAGLQKDQRDINAIIAEVSKGSKFYENEKRKDQELTERISKLHEQLATTKESANVGRIEATTDKLLAELEAQRDLSQTIVHVDMDAFYASVEILHNPDLKDKPFGVGSKSGVLTTASYEARKFGVRSGMAGFVAAKLCPELIFVPNVFSRYSEMSARVMAVFKRYDPNMLVAGCDEGYLNITRYCKEHGREPGDVVQQMRREVNEDTKLTVSAGIAPNKMLAKICSDKNKPNGQFHLPFEVDAIKAFVRDLSIRKIPGVGRVNERLLEAVGVQTCQDIFAARADLYILSSFKAVHLPWLLAIHLGIGSNDVAPGTREERRSIGAERTFSTLSDRDRIMGKLEEVVNELYEDMKEGGWVGRTITLKYKLDTFQVFTRAKSFDRWISSKEDLLQIGRELLLAEGPLKLRLLGLRVTKLKDLKAPESSSGIKRFLEKSKDGDSPRKRSKPNSTSDPEFIDVDALPQLDDQDLKRAVSPLALTSPTKSSTRTRIEPAEAEHTFFASSPEPEPEPEPNPAPDPPDSDTDTNGNAALPSSVSCPVCSHELSGTNNDEVNKHIDFCLSRGVIRAAAQETPPSPRKRIRPPVPPAKRKPDSGSKGRKKGVDVKEEGKSVHLSGWFKRKDS